MASLTRGSANGTASTAVAPPPSPSGRAARDEDDATGQPNGLARGARQATAEAGVGGGSSGGGSGDGSGGGRARRRALLRWPRLNDGWLGVDQLVALNIAALQCVNVWRNWGRAAAPAGQASTLLVLAAALVGALAPWVAIDFYQRNREWVQPLLRILLFLPPSMRTPGVGTALALERAAPRVGPAGALADLYTVLLANKGAFGGQHTLAPLLPLATLLTNPLLLVLSWNPAGYCATPLLRHPLTQRRIGVLARALELASLPMVLLQAAAPPGVLSPVGDVLQPDRTPPDALCYAALSFLHIFCLLPLPLLLAARHYRRTARQAASPAANAPGRRGKARALLARGAAAADRTLATLLAPREPMRQLIVIWWLLAYAWQVSKLLLLLDDTTS